MPITQSISPLFLPQVRTPFQPLWRGHESAEFWDQHLPGPGVLHDCGPTILFPGLFGHQITWPQTYPNSLRAVVGGLHCDLCHDTPGWVPPYSSSRPGPSRSAALNLAQVSYPEGVKNSRLLQTFPSTLSPPLFLPDRIFLRITMAVIGKGCLIGSMNCLFMYMGELYPTVMRWVGVSWRSLGVEKSGPRVRGFPVRKSTKVKQLFFKARKKNKNTQKLEQIKDKKEDGTSNSKYISRYNKCKQIKPTS